MTKFQNAVLYQDRGDAFQWEDGKGNKIRRELLRQEALTASKQLLAEHLLSLSSFGILLQDIEEEKAILNYQTYSKRLF